MSAKLGLVPLVGLALLVVPATPVRVQAPPAPATPPACGKAGTYTADVDGAPAKGVCRGFVDQAAPVSFNIPPGQLFDALKAFLEQSGSRGWVPLDLVVAGATTGGVAGVVPPREALERLLSGTQVTYVQDQTGTFRFPPLKETPVPGGRCIWDKSPPNACPAQ